MSEEGKPTTGSREEDTLDVLSNPIGLKLFRLVATTSLDGTSRTITSDFLQTQTNATRKQYYANMFRLVNKASLISRKRGSYVLSNYGKIIFHSLDLISRGSKCFWRLKALDTDDLSLGGIPAEKIMEIGASLIDDREILRIVFKSIPIEGKDNDHLYESPNQKPDQYSNESRNSKNISRQTLKPLK
jgi:hypothetical protein